jgi:hypothetical protein
MPDDIDELTYEKMMDEHWDAMEIEHARKLVGSRIRTPKAVQSGGLLDMRQAAGFLGMSERTLREHMRAGAIKYVDVGRGTQRRAPRFARQDLSEFQEKHRGQQWPSTKEVRSTITNSSFAVLDFGALRAERAKGKRKKSNARSARKRPKGSSVIRL